MKRTSIITTWGKALTNPKHPLFFPINDVLALVTIVSVLAIVLETVPTLSTYQPFFTFVEWFSVALFSLEYIARVVVTKPRSKYIFSFFGLIDLISIVPSFLGAGNLTFLKSARALRIIRLLRLIRSTKLKTTSKDEHLNLYTINVLIYCSALLIALLTFGTLLYLNEESVQFASIPAAMWWTLKVFVGGVAIEQPLSQAGQVFHVFAVFTGMLLFGLLISVVGNIFRSAMFPEHKRKR